MSYCSQSDYVNKFGEPELIQLTDRVDCIAVNTAVLAEAQSAADADIDKYLRMKGWAVPLTIASADIKAIALDLVRFHLYVFNRTKDIQDDYDRRIGELKDYVAGKLMLDIGDPNISTASAGDVDFYVPDKVFGDAGLRGF